MTTPDHPRDDEAALDAAWQAARDGSAPSPAVRAAILAEAARATQMSRAAAAAPAAHGEQRFDPAPPAANDAHWKLRAAAAVAVLGLVGLIAQQALRQRPPPASVEYAPAAAPVAAPAAVSATAPAATPAAARTAAAPAAPGVAEPEVALAPAPPPRAMAPAMREEANAAGPPVMTAAGGAQSAAAARVADLAATAEPARMAKAAAPAEADPWARDTEALLGRLLARRDVAPGAVQVNCAADRCEIAGPADAVRGLLQAPELDGRLRVAADRPVAGSVESDAQSGTVRYTLERVPGS